METKKLPFPADLNGKCDAELLRLYTEARSEAAFAVLGHRYAGLVYAACLRELGDQTQAEDAAQAVFLLLSQKAAALARYETLAGWLYKASCYTSRNLRKQNRRQRKAEGKAAMLEATAPTSAGNELWESIEPHFHDALKRLKPADRDAVLLRYVQELSLSEVGACLEVSENTARMRVNRALDKIRVHLARAGIVVGLGALVAVIEERAVQAAPQGVLAAVARIAASGPTTPSGTGIFPGPLPALLSAKGIAASICGLFVLGGGTSFWLLYPHRLGLLEQQRQFAVLSSGKWQGTITFIDDRSRKQYQYPTVVKFSVRDAGRTLAMVSTYTGSPQVDTFLFTGKARTGGFTVQNTGPRISHSLSATGELIQAGGSFAFQGNNAANAAQVRLQILRNGESLTVREEYRPVAPLPFLTPFSPYTLRNQYTLQRVP